MQHVKLNSNALLVIGEDSNEEGISYKNLAKGIELNLKKETQQKEILKAAKWLINKGFIVKTGKKYKLTLTGKEIYKEYSNLNTQSNIFQYFFNKIENENIYIPKLSYELMQIINYNFGKPKNRYIISEFRKINKETFENDISANLIAAILKVSNYKVNKFKEAIKGAKKDWRDILVYAKFDPTNDYEYWIQKEFSKIPERFISSNNRIGWLENQLQFKKQYRLNFISKMLSNFNIISNKQTESDRLLIL